MSENDECYELKIDENDPEYIKAMKGIAMLAPWEHEEIYQLHLRISEKLMETLSKQLGDLWIK